MSGAPDSKTVSLLTPIWERLLRRSPIGVDRNFFDLGGDASVAARLFSEIAEACGQRLPIETICRAPTIVELAGRLDRTAGSQAKKFPESPLVFLNAGMEQPPVFISHGLDGGVIKFFPLVRHIPSRRAFYGIQARGFDGQRPLDRVEDMVPPYLEAIQKVQPHGPYCLIGYSFGGLVMLEIARRLLAQGEKIAELVMLDSYPHLRQLSAIEKVRVMARRANGHLSEILRLSPHESFLYVQRRWQHRSRTSSPENESMSDGPADMPARVIPQLVFDRAEVALGCYQPQFYPGKITFLRSETGSYFPKNPVSVWAHLAAEFECETVTGDHQSMLTEHCVNLATVLNRYLWE